MAQNDSVANMAAASFEILVAQAGSDANKLLALASVARSIGRPERAYALARQAGELGSDDPHIRQAIRKMMSAGVPAWHFSIVRDNARNSAWEEAIRRAVGPDTRVLDIGAGSGLLAMMAARAGAGAVYTCEMNPAIADAALEIIARNGLSERVTLIAKHSDELDPERDLGGKADVPISEIISNNLLGQGILGIMADARRRLLNPAGRMIPAAAEIRVALAYWKGLADRKLADADPSS